MAMSMDMDDLWYKGLELARLRIAETTITPASIRRIAIKTLPNWENFKMGSKPCSPDAIAVISNARF